MGDDREEKVNEVCVGPTSEQAGKADSCAGCPNKSDCSSGKFKNQIDPALDEVKERLSDVKHIVSGKKS